METPRTPEELCAWVERKTSALSETKETRRFARTARLPKKLWEEIRPLCLFGHHLYAKSDAVKCRPKLGNQSYDATIEFEDPSISPVYVEITYAKAGHDEHLRLEKLSTEGHVNWLGALTVTGTKASGRQMVEIENEAVEHKVTVDKNLELVRESLNGKSGKTFGRNHVLVVVVDDYIPFRYDEGKRILEKWTISAIETMALDFKAVFLLGSSGNYLSCVYGDPALLQSRRFRVD